MKATELYEEIRSYCLANADDTIVKKYSRYFKEGYDAYGLSREQLEGKVASILTDKSVNMKLVLTASRLLVKSGKYEETSFAILLLKGFSEQFTPETFEEIGKWFEIGIINWGHTDVICGLLISLFFERNVISLDALSDWRNAANKYQRRAVPVAIITLLKSCKNYAPLFTFIEPLMLDIERVVHQGLGWFLREAWKLKRKETEAFLLKWKNNAARLIFQYATEKMTAEEKKRFKKKGSTPKKLVD
jgi:3-methyladenine DNA glycosylase AlkD